MTASKKLLATDLLHDIALKREVLEVFIEHGHQPKKELGYEVRKRLKSKMYRHLGDSEAVFTAIRGIVYRLEEDGQLTLNATGTHYKIAPGDTECAQPTGDSRDSQEKRKSSDRHAGRQSLVGTFAH